MFIPMIFESPIAEKKLQYDWDAYYAGISACADSFHTTLQAISFECPQADENKTEDNEQKATSYTAFGDEGEEIVYEYEKERVSKFNARLANKVLSLGKTKGIGYDIQSVIAEPGDNAEFVKYIEVKSTKRLTCPDINNPLWLDTINITRNEWVAAHQHRGYYAIYRVFFTRDGIFAYVIEDVAEKIEDGRIRATPMIYRADYSNNSVNRRIELQGSKEHV